MLENNQSLVLIGLMGAGKTSIGRRLAQRLALPFYDSDQVIEEETGVSITEIFADKGEAWFRERERATIARLLEQGRIVLATGGGAYMNAQTRAVIAERALSLWLRADLETLVERTSRRTTRPLLMQGDPREILKRLMDERYGVYAQADLIVDSDAQASHDATVDRIMTLLEKRKAAAKI